MGLYDNWNGKGLNHVETLYQRGERELAMHSPACSAARQSKRRK